MKVKSESGFSYIEVMVAMVILLVGILALLSGISGAVLQSRGQEQQLMAKHLASTTMESIMSVKETDPTRMGWNAVGNIGSNPDPVSGIPLGIFVVGRQNVRTGAGPDEVIGTADDNGTVVPGYQRQIVITDQCDPDRPSPNCPTPGTAKVRIRLIEVTVFYFVGRMQRQEQLTTVLSDYAVTE